MAKELMIIDTDGGVDDILALILAVINPNWQILAILCGFGNIYADQSCENVRKFLNVFNRTDIPVYKGCETSILGEVHVDTVYMGVDGIGGASPMYQLPKEDMKSEHAANVLVQLVDKYPGKITLVALGPLTNLALAHKLEPNYFEKLKKLFIMGGSVEGKGNINRISEFNFSNDPEAAFIVVKEFNSDKILIPFEACLDNTIFWNWYEEWISKNTAASKFIFNINNHTIRHVKNDLGLPGYGICDLLAMSSALFPQSVIRSRAKNGVVELCGKETRAGLIVDWRPNAHDKPNVVIHDLYNMTMLQDLWDEMTN